MQPRQLLLIQGQGLEIQTLGQKKGGKLRNGGKSLNLGNAGNPPIRNGVKSINLGNGENLSIRNDVESMIKERREINR